MDGEALHAELRRFDCAGELPRLGGMARADGVVIVSERFWAFAGTDGALREGVMPPQPRAVRAIPLVRGLVKLFASLAPLLRRRGVASGRERRLLLAAVLAPLALVLLPETARTAAGIAITLAVLAWLLRGRTLHLHGAEHRAVAAAEERLLEASWHGRARPTRFAPRCGTNFAALVLPVTLVFERLWDLPTSALSPLAITLVSLALTMEIWQLVHARGGVVARVFLAPGLALQRLTTREPSLTETQVALRAVASVLRREHLSG